MAPRSAFEYKPVSVLEPFALAETPELDLARFAEDQRVAVVRDTVAAVYPEAHTIATGRGVRRGYDLLLVTVGAVPLEGVPGAQPFRGRADHERVARLLEEYDGRRLRRLAFAVPSSSAWTLPVYELALLTANELRVREVDGAELVVVTPEPAPLSLFGQRASEELGELLRIAGVTVKTATHPRRFEDGVLHSVPESALRTDRVIALPRFVGHRIAGLPSDHDGFIPTDEHGRVSGVEDVYAAGDTTNFPVKQGGIACQQADAAAESIASRAGAVLEPEPFRPVMRGLLLSGMTARYLESDASGGHGEGPGPRFALWEPAGKVFGRHLLPTCGTSWGRSARAAHTPRMRCPSSSTSRPRLLTRSPDGAFRGRARAARWRRRRAYWAPAACARARGSDDAPDGGGGPVPARLTRAAGHRIRHFDRHARGTLTRVASTACWRSAVRWSGRSIRRRSSTGCWRLRERSRRTLRRTRGARRAQAGARALPHAGASTRSRIGRSASSRAVAASSVF